MTGQQPGESDWYLLLFGLGLAAVLLALWVAVVLGVFDPPLL